MSYLSVKNFIENCPEPETYNFEREYENGGYWEMQTYERYFAYKASAEKESEYEGSKYVYAKNFVKDSEKFKDIPDCDGTKPKENGVEQKSLSYLAREIYRTLWDWRDIPEEERENLEYKIKEEERYGNTSVDEFGPMGPETMNSVQTVMNETIKEIIGKEENKDLLFCKKYKNVSIAYMLELYGNPECHDKFVRELEKEPALKAYIEAYHMLGNFTLVPEYFNPYRNEKVKDYWDRSLTMLKEKKPEEIWEYKTRKIKWKKEYFVRYVNYFFMWDYTDAEGNPVEISRGDRTDFLKETVKRIKRRGCFMVLMLKLYQQMGAESYHKMRDALFLRDDKIYCDYEEVFDRIENYFGENMPEVYEYLLEETKEKIQRISFD